MLKAPVLSDVGLELGPDTPWFKVYNHARKLWERVRLNHVISIQPGRPEILLKALDVNICNDFSKFTDPSTAPPHIRNNLQREHDSVKKKAQKRLLEVDAAASPTSSSKCGSTSIARRSPPKRSRLQSGSPEPPSSHRAPMASSKRLSTSIVHRSPSKWPHLQSGSPEPSSEPSSSHHAAHPHHSHNHQATFSTHSQSPISISSSAPPTPVSIQPSILEFTDSDSGPSFRTPVARRHCHPHMSRTPLSSPQQSIKQGVDVPTRRTPHRRDTSKRWPTDYHVVDVANVLEACAPPPPGMTIARVFESLVFQIFKPSTFYDTRNRWNIASQEDRDTFEGYGHTDDGLWSVFASRQRQTRRAHRIKTHREESYAISSEDEASDSR